MPGLSTWVSTVTRTRGCFFLSRASFAAAATAFTRARSLVVELGTYRLVPRVRLAVRAVHPGKATADARVVRLVVDRAGVVLQEEADAFAFADEGGAPLLLLGIPDER